MSEFQFAKYIRPIQLAGYNIKKMIFNQNGKSDLINLNIEFNVSVVNYKKIKNDEMDVYQAILELVLVVKNEDDEENDIFTAVIEGGFNSPAVVTEKEFEDYLKEYALFELYIIVKQKIYEITSINTFDSPVVLPTFDFNELAENFDFHLKKN